MKIETKDLTLRQVIEIIYGFQEDGFEAFLRGRGNGDVYIEVWNK